MSKPTNGCDLLSVKLTIGKGILFIIIISEKRTKETETKEEEK